MRQLKWLSLLGLLLLGPSTYAQSVRFQSQAISSRGAGIANATVAVCGQPANTNTQPCSPLATLATSTSTTSGGANPLTADSFGNFFFYAAPGRYTVQIYGPAVFGQLVIPDLEIASTSGAASITNCNISNWLFNNTNCFAGADFGAQFNTAYGAMPATGTRFHSVPGSFSFTTPMVATTVANSLMLSCPVEQSTQLTFTPTTGTALTLAGGGGAHNEGGVQVENCTFYGSGSGNATTGLQLGAGANGLANSTFKTITVGKSAATAFGTGINFTTATYLDHFYNSHIIGNNVGASICGEGINFYGGLFGSNATALNFGNCASQSHNHGTSFDDNTTVAVNMATSGGNTAIWNCTACHFENFGLGTDSYLSLTSTSSTATLVAGELNDDRTAGTSSGFVTASAGELAVLGTTVAGGVGSVNTQAFNLSGTVNAVLFPFQLSSAATIPNIVTPAYMAPASGGGAVILCPMQNTSNTLNCAFKGTGPEGATFGPSIDWTGAETGGKQFRIREHAGLFEITDVGAGGSLRARLVGGNFNSEFIGLYSDQGGACTNTGAGGLTLSAGWGTTAAPSGVVGVGQTCEWTVTSSGTGQAANPTITWTLPNAMPTATIVCTADVHGGTQAFTTFDQTTLSATAPVFTFNGTPVAGNTVKVVIKCGP